MLRVDTLPSPQPLQPDFTHPNPDVVRAYNVCRAAEHLINQDRPPRNDTVEKMLINVRILGHLLSQSGLLLDTALSKVAEDILSSQAKAQGSNEALMEELTALGEFYRNYFIRPFRKYKGKTPNVTSHPSRDSFELTKEEIDQVLAEPRDADYDMSRKLAMKREDHRCIVTRILDFAYALRFRTPDGGMYEEDTEALHFCHIFSESTNEDIEQSGLLNSFGYSHLVNHFATGDRVHFLENVMMMTEPLHHRFDTLKLWFEPVEVYSILKPPHGLTQGQLVIFQSAEPRFALPNRESLRIHAACCRVAHLSGACGLLDELERDMDSDPDPILEVPEFAKALHAHLEHLSLETLIEAH
ncbi:hypothetical protein LXA43DRAFT_1043365 [Ganoderma leucocontextum]|nr:hypothetical protein LXA43DRAFT_1043365 [Ganoderma leucocontextum]